MLCEESSWKFQDLQAMEDACQEIAENDLGLDYYPNQLEVISYEQMLDAYSSVGLPLMYSHWSFGLERTKSEKDYEKGRIGLAYEIVINSDPCISYLMENNTSVTQLMVIAHAAFGHNSFFKNNYLFKENTNASFIVDYLAYAKKYIEGCELKYGLEAVESVLDACHVLKNYGIDYSRRPSPLSKEESMRRKAEREDYDASRIGRVWDTIPVLRDSEAAPVKRDNDGVYDPLSKAVFPEENILYFIEKYSPVLPTWKKEIIRIVRKISQYLYPQGMTKIMNEGWACFTHYHIMEQLHSKGSISNGNYLEFLASHAGVLGNGNKGVKLSENPYQLGYAIFRDLKRVCLNPTDAERKDNRLKDFAGDPDWRKVLKNIAYNYRDESFVRQFLNPQVIADLNMFKYGYEDKEEIVECTVDNVAVEDHASHIRKALANNLLDRISPPKLEVASVKEYGDRVMTLRGGMNLSGDVQDFSAYVSFLWGYGVKLNT